MSDPTMNLVLLAARMRLSPTAAIALPTVITVAAAKIGMAERTLVNKAMYNAALRDYLAEVCEVGASKL